MDKRNSRVTACITPELEIAIKTIADLDGVTVSDLINSLLMKHVADKREAYLRLSAIFGNNQDK